MVFGVDNVTLGVGIEDHPLNLTMRHRHVLGSALTSFHWRNIRLYGKDALPLYDNEGTWYPKPRIY